MAATKRSSGHSLLGWVGRQSRPKSPTSSHFSPAPTRDLSPVWCCRWTGDCGPVAASRRHPILQRTDPSLARWQRLIDVLPGGIDVRSEQQPGAFRLRRLTIADLPAVQQLDADLSWVAATWGGPAGLACSGRAWAILQGDRAVGVAAPFFSGQRYEDIGVVTEPELRGRGFARSCTAALIGDIRSRGRTPSWTTSADNAPSRAIATRMGFIPSRRDVPLVLGRSVPEA